MAVYDENLAVFGFLGLATLLSAPRAVREGKIAKKCCLFSEKSFHLIAKNRRHLCLHEKASKNMNSRMNRMVVA